MAQQIETQGKKSGKETSGKYQAALPHFQGVQWVVFIVGKMNEDIYQPCPDKSREHGDKTQVHNLLGVYPIAFAVPYSNQQGDGDSSHTFTIDTTPNEKQDRVFELLDQISV